MCTCSSTSASLWCAQNLPSTGLSEACLETKPLPFEFSEQVVEPEAECCGQTPARWAALLLLACPSHGGE